MVQQKADPPATIVPLIDATFSEVCSRVAYRLIVLEYRKRPSAFKTPATALFYFGAVLGGCGFEAMATWVSAAGYHIAKGRTLASWKAETIARARKREGNRRSGAAWKAVP